MITWSTEKQRLRQQADAAMNCADGLAKTGEGARGIVYAINGLTSAVLLMAAEIHEAAETCVRVVND